MREGFQGREQRQQHRRLRQGKEDAPGLGSPERGAEPGLRADGCVFSWSVLRTEKPIPHRQPHTERLLAPPLQGDHPERSQGLSCGLCRPLSLALWRAGPFPDTRSLAETQWQNSVAKLITEIIPRPPLWSPLKYTLPPNSAAREPSSSVFNP